MIILKFFDTVVDYCTYIGNGMVAHNNTFYISFFHIEYPFQQQLKSSIKLICIEQMLYDMQSKLCIDFIYAQNIKVYLHDLIIQCVYNTLIMIALGLTLLCFYEWSMLLIHNILQLMECTSIYQWYVLSYKNAEMYDKIPYKMNLFKRNRLT